MQPGRVHRFTTHSPCPVCLGYDRLPAGRGVRCYGFLSGDGRYAHCTRDELAGLLPAESNGTFAHRIDGPCRCGTMHGVTHNPHGTATRRRAERDDVPVWRDPAWQRTACYDYHGADGQAVFRVQRWERLDHSAKRFIQERPDPGSQRGWRSGLGDLLRVPYHLPAILRAPPERPILIVEGEKAVDTAVRVGFLATTNPEGARPGAWRPELTPYFRGRHVVILPDNDDVGMAHAREIAAALRTVAASVRGLELPGLPPKGDICDWLAGGGTRDELAGLVQTAPVWCPVAPPPAPVDRPRLALTAGQATDLLIAGVPARW